MVEEKKIKVLIVYHSTDTPSVKAIFDEIGGQKGIELRVLGPSLGWNPFRQMHHQTPSYKRERHYDIVSGRIFFGRKNCANPYLWGLGREIRRFKPDIIHVMNEVTSLVLFQALILRNLFRPSAKVLFWGNENLLEKKWKNGPLFKRLIWNYSARHAQGGAYVNSEGVEQLKALGFPLASRVVVSYWGVDLDKYNRVNVNGLLKDYGLEDKFRLGFVGRIDPEKGLSTVLEALVRLPPHVVFLVVGNGGGLPELQKQIVKLNLEKRVFHFPAVADLDVAKYLSLFNLFILPSLTTPNWKEQFGRVIPEAMACEVPVVGSSSGAIPEVLKDCGFIFKEGNPEDLTRVIHEYLRLNDSERESLKKRAKAVAYQNYSTEIFAHKFTHLYRDVLNY